MSFSKYVLGLVALLLSISVTFELQCLNEKGNPVDWYVLYKLPKFPNSQNPLIAAGTSYMFITSNTVDLKWQLSHLSINDSLSLPGRTLSVLYDAHVKENLYLLYNDEPPSASTTSDYAHAKGVVVANAETGFWFVHSVPKFPIEAFSNDSSNLFPKKNSYFYPKTATRFGQSFICVSLHPKDLQSVGGQLLYYRPKVYDKNIPEGLGTLYTNFSAVANGKFIKLAPYYHKAFIKTAGGVTLSSFAKSGKFNKELYSDWVAVDLAASLNVETWSNGAGDLPSECNKPYHVQDVRQVAVRISNLNVTFATSHDHSKWAVTLHKTPGWTCIGDINRMKAQLKRGGGTLCLQNTDLWNQYFSLIDAVEACPINNVFKNHISADEVQVLKKKKQDNLNYI